LNAWRNAIKNVQAISHTLRSIRFSTACALILVSKPCLKR